MILQWLVAQILTTFQSICMFQEWTQNSQDSLDSYLDGSGSTSVKSAIEGDTTLGGVVSSARVVEASNYGVYTVNSIDYLGVEFSVEIIT